MFLISSVRVEIVLTIFLLNNQFWNYETWIFINFLTEKIIVSMYYVSLDQIVSIEKKQNQVNKKKSPSSSLIIKIIYFSLELWLEKQYLLSWNRPLSKLLVLILEQALT